MADLWTQIKDNLPTLVALVATVGFFVGLYQYSRAQRWKRAEYIAAQIKYLEENPRFRRAMKMLDFRASYITRDDGQKIAFDDKILTEALPHELLKPSTSDDQEAIRLAFCDFFDGLERLHHFLVAGLIKHRNLDPYLPYWFRRFTTTDYKSKEFIDSIWTFIDGYEYAGVRKLAEKFKFQPPDKDTAYENVAQRELALAERALGPEDLGVATILNSLAKCYQDQGKYADAEPGYEKALAIREKALGPEHPSVAESLKNYATLLRKTNRGAEAQEREARAQAIRAKHA